MAVYFALFYYAVMRNEENDLRARFGAAFDEYAARVPLFFPRLFNWRAGAANAAQAPQKLFSWAQYRAIANTRRSSARSRASE